MASNSKIIKKTDVEKEVSLEARLDMEDPELTGLASDRKVISREDMEGFDRARKIIEEAREKARIIKEGARDLFRQIEQKVAQSQKEGFEKGRQEGLARVTETLATIKKQNQQFLAGLEKKCLALVYEISQKVIGDTLKISDEALLEMIRRALQSAMGHDLTLFIHPQDFDRVKANEKQLLASIETVQTLNLKPSENVKPGGCVIESELGTIDAELDYQLEAIARALGVDRRGAKEAG